MYFRETNSKDITEFKEIFYFWVAKKLKNERRPKVWIVYNFQHSQDSKECMMCCDWPLLCSQKAAIYFFKVSKESFAFLAVGPSLFMLFSPMLFLGKPYFAAIFFNLFNEKNVNWGSFFEQNFGKKSSRKRISRDRGRFYKE